MKKFFIMMVALFATLTMSAQITTQNPKALDNTYIGVFAGASVPLTFNREFPLNGNASLVLGKELTPIFGLQIEGTTHFGSAIDGGLRAESENNVWVNGDGHNIVRLLNVGVNSTINLSNLLCGYNGTPRTFEVSTVAGLGWLHTFVPYQTDVNNLSAKTGLNFTFNLGRSKANSIVFQPAVLWKLTNGRDVQFNKCNAQLGLALGFVHHFGTSNGTHSFREWNVGELNAKINSLREDLARKPKVVERVVTQVVEKEVSAPQSLNGTSLVVNFAQNSAELTDEAKAILDKIPSGTKVSIVGTTSPEGTAKRNATLSEERANSVASYLKGNGVEVVSAKGNEYGRSGIVTIEE